MVRIIVGALIRVGEGKIKPNEIKDIIESKERSKAGKAVPSWWIMFGGSFLLNKRHKTL